MTITRITSAAICALLAGAVLAGALPAASTKDRLHAKRAQAKAVFAQVNALDKQFEASVEAWNGARYELGVTRKELASERIALRWAERQRRIAIAHVSARIVALYESTDEPSTLAIFLGSSNVSDLLDRIQAVRDISSADHQLAVQATATRDRYASLERRTAALEQRRAADVVQLASQRQRIGSMLAERKRLLASVQSEVATLQAQEARRQALLAAQARARLAAAQAEARREEAAARARAAAAARRPAPTTTAAVTTTSTTTAEAPPANAASPPTTTAEAPAPPAIPAAGPGHPEAATIALRYLGVPYVWGGATPAGFDCSGLVMYVYAQLGIMLPHFAAAQYGLGTPVSRDQLQPGDLVFFDGLNHVGIYIGGGEMVHAPHTGDVVRISPLSDFGAGYVGARRL